MTTPTEISNLTLDRVGGEFIEDINEASPHARLCKRWFNHARQHVLAIFDWTFARRVETLALSAFTPPEDWAFSYLLPADCLAARRIYNPSIWSSCGNSYEGLLRLPRIPYFVMLGDDGVTKTLCTNMPEARLVYTCDQEDSSTFSPEFVTNLTYLLGHFIGYKVSGKGTVADKMLQLYMQFALPLMGNDANQGEDKQDPDSGFVKARY